MLLPPSVGRVRLGGRTRGPDSGRRTGKGPPEGSCRAAPFEALTSLVVDAAVYEYDAISRGLRVAIELGLTDHNDTSSFHD